MPPHEVYIETHLGGGAVMRYKRPSMRNIGIEIDPEVIRMWASDNRVGCELIHGDAVTYLKEYRFTGKELIYCDPPYLRETRKKYYPLYKYEYTYEQHIKLLEVIKDLPCMVMISGYRSKLYTEFLKDWHTHFFRAATHNGTAVECVWMSYPPPEELHDYRYLGSTFRERERIKKKLKRWVAKLKSMPVLERQALLSAIDLVCK
jgi:site-specific DNA-adenine methylase